MNRKLRLVDASMADVDELSAAGRRFFTQAYGPHSEPDDLVVHVGQYFGRDAVEAELQKAEITYTVALDGDAIAGFIKLRRGPSPEAIPAADAVEVQQLYVDAIAHTLANVNTTSFKKSTVQFQDLFYQTLRARSAPAWS